MLVARASGLRGFTRRQPHVYVITMNFFLAVLAFLAFSTSVTLGLFRSFDPNLGFYYHTEYINEQATLFIAKSRAATPEQIFQSPVNIYSAFHSSDGKYLVVNHGSARYGNIPVVFDDKRDIVLSEEDFREIMGKELTKNELHPEEWYASILYAPIREMKAGKAFLYVSGSLERRSGLTEKKQITGVFYSLDLSSKKLTSIKREEGANSWGAGGGLRTLLTVLASLSRTTFW